MGATQGASAPGREQADKEPLLAPTHALLPPQFEDFTERLLKASVFCDDHPERIVDAHRWGRPGDAQQGIDFAGQLSDGRTADWQCKRKDHLNPAEVREAVAACVHVADVHHLVFSGIASSAARSEIENHPRWRLVDRRDLSGMLAALPLHQRRQVLDETWGKQERKRLMQTPTEDAFLTLSTFRSERVAPGLLLHDRGSWVGRAGETATLDNALARTPGAPSVIVVTGPGGRGKTRLISESLARLQKNSPGLQVLVLSPGRALDAAALQEIPHVPAVVVIDDAHQDPSAITPLLHHLRRVDGVQLILGTRPSGTTTLRTVLAAASWAGTDVAEIDVGELSKRDAWALVRLCSEGIRLPPGAATYFAEQAVHSPHVAVIAVELLRTGRLSAPIVIDGDFRGLVLARYQEVMTGDVEGIPSATVRACLALYAALGPVEDGALHTELASFCGQEFAAHLRVVHGLLDRGVLVRSNGLTRVVPDVLADDLLEREAAVGSISTGFGERLWSAFGTAHASRLLVSLAELDWRLARTGGPAIFGNVWNHVLADLGRADHHQLYTWVQRLRDVATTQPASVIVALEDIRARLDAEAVVGEPTDEPDGPWWGRAWTAEDVRRQLPEVYGICALHDPDLLETVLEALWTLESQTAARRRSPNDGVIAQRLAKLVDIPDATFPRRITAKVGEWLSRAPLRGQPNPAELLKPLLEKEESSHYLEGRKLYFNPHAISATAVRPLRDQIRSVLTGAALGSDLRRAAGAIAVIGYCLHQPTGQFGRVVAPEEVLGWEDDDLATLLALDTIGRTTPSPLIRRLVREQVSWSAELARSPRLQHAALTIATYLDEQEDTVQELLLDTWTTMCPSRRGKPVPTISELSRDREARRIKMADLTEAQCSQAESERVHKKIEDRQAAHQALAAQAITPMATGGDPSQFISQLDTAIRQLREALPDRHISLWHLWAEVAKEATAHLPSIVRLMSALSPGPLDFELHHVLRHWQLNTEAGLLQWLKDFEGFRTEVRLAVGVAFDAYSWADAGPEYARVHRIGVVDPDARVRQRFLSASHPLLKASPATTVADLLAADISPGSALNALQQSCRTNPTQWGSSLLATDAASVLELIAVTGWEDWTVGHIVGGIAAAHPDLVLDRLLGASRAGQLPANIESLGETLGSRSQLFVDWLTGVLDQQDLSILEPVVSLILDAGLTDSQGALLAERATGWPSTQRLKLVRVLRDVPTWPLRQPDLARALVRCDEQSESDDEDTLRTEIEDATHLQSWGCVNGISDELDSARDAALAAATAEHDPTLRQMFEDALNTLTAQIDDARQREADDHDWPE